MISTVENIVDPVEFLSVNMELVERLGRAESELISGSDIDMLVTNLGVEEPQSVGRIDSMTSRVLGRLYMEGVVQGQLIGSTHVKIDWYPSPNHVNDMSEKLDLTPGKDVMKFVHSTYDAIPPKAYLAHLRSGEFPQSTGTSYLFWHDRDEDHAPGVLLAPPAFAQGILERKQTIRWFDMATADIGRITNALALNLDNDVPPHFDEIKTIYGLSATADMLGIKRWRKKENLQAAVELIFNHLKMLKPKIEKLEKECVSQSIG